MPILGFQLQPREEEAEETGTAAAVTRPELSAAGCWEAMTGAGWEQQLQLIW